MKRIAVVCALLPALSLIAINAAGAGADEALVIGVNTYPYLRQGSNLEGSVNDANAVAAILTTDYGFTRVTLLTNEQATKAAILGKLADLKGRLKTTERFVFYMASHGDKTPDGAVLLPADAVEADNSRDITRTELYSAVSLLPAASKTVILDSCFSGGLTRKSLGGVVLHIRFHQREKSKGIQNVNKQDNTSNIAIGQDVCYFVASQEQQTSGEDKFGGAINGVFTHFLAERLKDRAHPRWGDIQKDVSGEVSDYMSQRQTPLLGPSKFANAAVFDADRLRAPLTSATRTVWDDYNEDYNDAAHLELLMTPNLKALKVKQQFTFNVNVGSEGWLVILDKDPDGTIYLLHPANGNLEDAHVKSSSLRLPADFGHSYSADAPGSEKAKAILFSNVENAKALLAMFPRDGSGLPLHKIRKITEELTMRYPFYTSVVTFDVEGEK